MAQQMQPAVTMTPTYGMAFFSSDLATTLPAAAAVSDPAATSARTPPPRHVSEVPRAFSPRCHHGLLPPPCLAMGGSTANVWEVRVMELAVMLAPPVKTPLP